MTEPKRKESTASSSGDPLVWYAEAQTFAAQGQLKDAERIGFLAYTETSGSRHDEIGLFLGRLLIRMDRAENARDVLTRVAASADPTIARSASEALAQLAPDVEDGYSHCTLCRRSSRDVTQLIAGPPPLFICDICVALISEIREDEPNRPLSDLTAICSFCGTKVTTDKAVLAMYQDEIAICYDCHDLMVQMVAEWQRSHE